MGIIIDNKYRFALAFVIAGFGLSISKVLENRSKLEEKFGAFTDAYIQDVRKMDSTRTAKKDSLENWYQLQLDSLERYYMNKNDLENLAN